MSSEQINLTVEAKVLDVRGSSVFEIEADLLGEFAGVGVGIELNRAATVREWSFAQQTGPLPCGRGSDGLNSTRTYFGRRGVLGGLRPWATSRSKVLFLRSVWW